MTTLICLIRAANLKDGRCIGENQPFETDAEEAEILIRGGIAKPAPAPAEPEPDLTNVKSPEPAPEPEPEPEPEKTIIKKRKR